VTRHANLYFLFLEDREANPIQADKNESIRRNVENFYKTLIAQQKVKMLKTKIEKDMY
jgi:hypothetical protein